MTKDDAVLLAKIWAVADHFEKSTGKPVLAQIVKEVTGATREQLRRFVKKGRLDLYYETSKDGQRQMAFTRPKERGETVASESGSQSRGREALGESEADSL